MSEELAKRHLDVLGLMLEEANKEEDPSVRRTILDTVMGSVFSDSIRGLSPEQQEERTWKHMLRCFNNSWDELTKAMKTKDERYNLYVMADCDCAVYCECLNHLTLRVTHSDPLFNPERKIFSVLGSAGYADFNRPGIALDDSNEYRRQFLAAWLKQPRDPIRSYDPRNY